MNAKLKKTLVPWYRLMRPICLRPMKLFLQSIPLFIWFLRDVLEYRKSDEKGSLQFRNIHPLIFNKNARTNVDLHYFYQHVWSFRLIKESGIGNHVDIGSKIDFVSLLSVITEVTFIDIRPLKVKLENFDSKAGTILALPYEDASIQSISCLHVIEHIGLGRYGDPIDPEGTRKAAKELVRVLAPGGNVYLFLPIGRPRVCFNAHRIHSPQEVPGMFEPLNLVEFSAVDERGEFVRIAKLQDFENAEYSCGLFYFQTPQ